MDDDMHEVVFRFAGRLWMGRLEAYTRAVRGDHNGLGDLNALADEAENEQSGRGAEVPAS